MKNRTPGNSLLAPRRDHVPLLAFVRILVCPRVSESRRNELWTFRLLAPLSTIYHTLLSLSLSLFYIPFLCHAIEGPQNRLFGLQAIILLSCVETPTAIATKASQEQRHRVPQVIWTVHVMNNLFLIISERHLGLHHGGRDAANFIPYISRLDLDPKSPCSLIPCAHKVQVACILSIIDSRICWYNFT